MLGNCYVLLELLLTHEVLVADNAGIGLPNAVHEVMNVAIFGSTELLATDHAAVVLFTGVAEHMLHHIDRADECCLTELAFHISHLSVLRLDVVSQQAPAFKAALALVALKARPIFVGGQQVTAQVGALRKGCMTLVTLVGSLARVHTLVILQPLAPTERLPTIPAAVLGMCLRLFASCYRGTEKNLTLAKIILMIDNLSTNHLASF